MVPAVADLTGPGGASRVTDASALPDADAAALLVIACGNPVRRDDGVAQAVLAQVRARLPALPPGVVLLDAGTDGLGAMLRMRQAERIVLIDACRSASEPGAIFELPGREAATPAPRGYSLHGMRWDHALDAGIRMQGSAFADRVRVLLVEAADVGFGVELSAPVAAAAVRVAEIVVERIGAHAAAARSN